MANKKKQYKQKCQIIVFQTMYDFINWDASKFSL